MACAAATDDSAASTTGMRDEDRSLSGESLSEWRSCEQVESESPSTSPPFWDTDGDDDDPECLETSMHRKQGGSSRGSEHIQDVFTPQPLSLLAMTTIDFIKENGLM